MIYIILYNKSMDICRSHERKERCRQSRVREVKRREMKESEESLSWEDENRERGDFKRRWK